MTLQSECTPLIADMDVADDPLRFDASTDSASTAKSRARRLLRTQADDLDDPEWLSI